MKTNHFFIQKPNIESEYTKVPNVLLSANLKASEKIILIYLLSNSETFKLSIYRISESTGSDERTVKNALKSLKDLNIIYNISENVLGFNLKNLENRYKITTSKNVPSKITTSKNAPIDSSNFVPNSSKNVPILGAKLHSNNTKQDNKQEKEEQDKEQDKKVFSENLVSSQVSNSENLELTIQLLPSSISSLRLIYEEYKLQFPEKKIDLNTFSKFYCNIIERVLSKENIKLTSTYDIEKFLGNKRYIKFEIFNSFTSNIYSKLNEKQISKLLSKYEL